MAGCAVREADKRGQSFGQVRKAYIRVVKDADGMELAGYASGLAGIALDYGLSV